MTDLDARTETLMLREIRELEECLVATNRATSEAETAKINSDFLVQRRALVADYAALLNDDAAGNRQIWFLAYKVERAANRIVQHFGGPPDFSKRGAVA